MFIDIATYGPAAEAYGQYVGKGRQIAVTGHFTYREWQATDGSTRSKHLILGRVAFGGREEAAGNQVPGGNEPHDE
jgi:single-stranded DNA-binding protein